MPLRLDDGDLDNAMIVQFDGAVILHKTTPEMKQQSTFTNWEFINTWAIGENQTYPYLRTHSPADINRDHAVNILELCILSQQWMANSN